MAAPEKMTALLKRSKRSVALSIKTDCFKNCDPQRLTDLLKILLNPETKSIDDIETLDWCRWLIAGGSTFEEFAKTVRQYDNAVTCGLVWTANFVAYRCRTCGVSPCMSLCADCFQAGNHEGHDYNMFRSQAGGACDCGDTSVMNQAGFCSRHGPNRQNMQAAPPNELMSVAETIMPRLFLRFLYHLRDNSKPEMLDTYLVAMQDAEQFLTLLHSLSDMGAAMRHVMAQALTNSELYSNLTAVSGGDNSSAYYTKSKTDYDAAVTSLKYPRGFEDYEDMPGLNQKLVHTTFLEELVFWTVKFEFPQKIVTLLLSLLPDQHYKEAFTRAFIQHYSRISRVLVNARDRGTVANRVVHISVQLFSNEQLACQMVQEYNLLYILIVSLNNMVEGILTESTLQDAHQNFHMVVDCGSEVMKEHCYWPIISDLINLLSHRQIAHKFLADPKLVSMWLELLSYFQGMNLNQRELHQHVEFEPDTYYAAFSAELEISASPMWSLISHCKEQGTAVYTRTMIQACQDTLQDWFDAICCKESTNPNPLQLTFHLPLHRYLATFMVQAIQQQGVELLVVLPPERMLKCLLIHLLQIQVAATEIYTGMWVRNGLQIKGQAMTYVQCHFCYSMVDADIYLMQVCASRLDPDYFVQTVLDRYHVSDWLSYNPNPASKSYKLEKEQQLAMVDGALQFLSLIVSNRTYLGMADKDLTRLEMATLLFVNDRHHSQLTDLMPEKSGMTGHKKDLFEPTLKDIANYKSPNFEPGAGLQQGTYVPKDEIWEEEFDPVHVTLRAVYRNDFQSAMDRYTEFMRKKGKYKGKSQPWPPFKSPGPMQDCYKTLYSILHCKTMHALMFSVLHKALKDPSLPESILFFAVHLLDLAVTVPCPFPRNRTRPVPSSVPDRWYRDWFSGSDLFENAREVIRDVEIPVEHVDLEHAGTMTVSMDTSSIEEMFQLAPSAIAGTSGPITAAHSGHIPAITMYSLPSNNTSSQSNLLPVHTSTNQTLPKYETRGVTTDQPKTQQIPVNESLLTILLKLHSRLSGKSGSYVPLSVSGRSVSDSDIGDGCHFVERLLDRMCRQNMDCARAVEEIYRTQMPKSSAKKGKDSGDAEDRRRKARERQQKLMADFASKQKAFMEQAMDTEESGEAGPSSSADTSQDSSGCMEEGGELFDCAICGQTTPSTAEKTVGLVVLLQSSSVLGHRPQTDTRRTLSLGDKHRQRITTCSRVQTKRLETLFRNFEETSCQTSVNIGWEGGVVVQTCGHYLHLSCHTSYVSSLMSQGNHRSLLVNKGEYSCPMCLQLANSVIPILPEESKYTLTRPVTSDPIQMVRDLSEMMVKRPITPRSTQVTRAMGSMMEDLTNATYGAFKTYTNSQTSESVLLFVCSVARTNLELETLQRKGDLSKPLPTTWKHCFLPLLHVLSMHSKILTTKPYTDLWSHITGVSCSEESSSVSLYQKDVPLLLKDPVALLIQLVLTLPASIEEGHYQFLVQVLYNVVFTQALCVVTCKFTEEERDAWKKGRHVPFNTLEGMLSHVITRLATSFLYEKEDFDVPAICQSVWSPQSVELTVQDLCVPFLRIACLIKFHIFGQSFPDVGDLSEFQYLSSYLRLSAMGRQAPNASSLTSADCVHWAVEEPHTLTRAWCSDLINFVNLHPGDGKYLLTVNTSWFVPRLIQLPDHFYQLFTAYRNKQCLVCSNIPKDPCICVICGTYLCFRESCCRQQNLYECVHHSIECGAGTGIFLLVNSSIVVVIRGPRATLWGSVYLDEHGEEDRDLKRGKPLFLSAQRYSLLESQWISHNFDHACKRWIWHQDRL